MHTNKAADHLRRVGKLPDPSLLKHVSPLGWTHILVQSRRNTKAAKRFIRKLMKQYGMPRVIITDKLRSYGAAKRDLAPSLEHRSHKGLNNRAEVSHKPTRRRERVTCS